MFICELHTIYFRAQAKLSTPESNSSQLGLYCSELGLICSIFPIITRQSSMCFTPSSSGSANCTLNHISKVKTNEYIKWKDHIFIKKQAYLSAGCSTGERWTPCPCVRLTVGTPNPCERIPLISLFEAPYQAYFT